MQVSVTPLDGNLDKYKQALSILGAKKAVTVMRRAMSYEGRKTYTAVKRAIRKQSSIPAKTVSAQTKYSPANFRHLATKINARGNYLGLSQFKPRQFQYGVRAKVWGRFQRYRSAFGAPGDNPNVVAALGGRPFHREGASRLPISMLSGPNVAVEMVRDDPPDVFYTSSARIADRVGKEIAAVLRGY